MLYSRIIRQRPASWRDGSILGNFTIWSDVCKTLDLTIKWCRDLLGKIVSLPARFILAQTCLTNGLAVSSSLVQAGFVSGCKHEFIYFMFSAEHYDGWKKTEQYPAERHYYLQIARRPALMTTFSKLRSVAGTLTAGAHFLPTPWGVPSIEWIFLSTV